MEIASSQAGPKAPGQCLIAPRRSPRARSLILLASIVGLLSVANYVAWIHSYFAADDWVLIGSITQVDWTPFDLLPWRFWQLPHEINPLHYYAPVLLILTWLPVKIGGYSPEPYHFSLILMHIGTSLFLFLSVLQLTQSRLKATIAGAIFAVHFGGTEAVGWFGANSHPIVGFFESMSLLLYVRFLATDRERWWWGALIPLFAASLTQASALAWFPVLVCLELFYARERVASRGMRGRFFILGILLAGIVMLQYQSLFSGRGGYRYTLGPWVLLNFFYYPLSTVLPSLEEKANRLHYSLFHANHEWNAFNGLIENRDAFNILLATALVVVIVVLLWTKGGRVGKFSVLGFAISLTPFLLLHGQGYRYLYTPLMFFSLASANTIGDIFRYFRQSSRTAAIAILAVAPVFVALSFAESQRQLFWWQQAGYVAHESLIEFKSLQPSLPRGAKIIFGGLPDTLQNTNAEVWRQGITQAMRAIYEDRTLRVEAYGKQEVERMFREELRDAPATYGYVWEDLRFRQLNR